MNLTPRTIEFTFSTEESSVFHGLVEEMLRRTKQLHEGETLTEINWPWKITQLPVKLEINPAPEVHRIDHS